MADIPPNLLKAEHLAEDIYTCWRELMITDRVQGGKDWPVWMKMDGEWRRTLIESVKMSCTATLKRIQEKNESDKLDQALDKMLSGPTKKKKNRATQRLCYVCGHPTSADNVPPICENCE